MTYKIEITRRNVTPAKFFAEIRFALKKKGISFDLDMNDFTNPYDPINSQYFVKDGKKISYFNGHKSEWLVKDAPCKSEICKNLPYDYQAYILNFDGSYFNEICEFTFDDDKTGHGYYYTANKDSE